VFDGENREQKAVSLLKKLAPQGRLAVQKCATKGRLAIQNSSIKRRPAV